MAIWQYKCLLFFILKSFPGSPEYICDRSQNSQPTLSQPGQRISTYFIFHTPFRTSQGTLSAEHIKMINDHIPSQWRAGKVAFQISSVLICMHFTDLEPSKHNISLNTKIFYIYDF